jgi:hypothetical protein
MSNHLLLRFTGLCGFVPKKAIDQPDNQMRVLLVDATLPDPGDPHGSHHHEAHFPVLICDFDSVVRGPVPGVNLRAEDRIFFEGGTKKALFFLNGQDLRVAGANPDSLSIAHGISTPRPECPDVSTGPGSNRPFFEWVAPLDLISTGSQNVNPACLQSNPHPSVFARVALTQGSVRTFQFAMDSSGKVVKWEFKVPAGGASVGHVQALAEIVQYDFEFQSGTSIDLISKPFGGSSGQEVTIRLQLTTVGLGGQAIAVIKNIPLLDIFSTRPLPPRDIDFHFSHFYRMSNSAGARNVPHPLADRCPGAGGPALGNPLCPPTSYAPNPNA